MSRTPLVHVDESLAGRRAGEVVALTEAECHHLARVLRLRHGDPVEVSDGAGAHAHGSLAGAAVELTSAATVTDPPRPRLRVVQALPKGRKLDDVVRVCVELGMDELVPVAAARSVRRPEGPRADKAVERWAAVARAACEQARRRHRPAVAGVVDSDQLRVDGLWLLAHPVGGRPLPEVLGEALGVPAAGGGHPDDPATTGAVTVAVGPEGGWTDDEVARLVAAGAQVVRLGPTVMRTEHAAAAALAVVGALTGRWSGPSG